tara:strand:+ start:55 stop:411 length:357 start_codon:yes stop_codon:yes gene_type:complete
MKYKINCHAWVIPSDPNNTNWKLWDVTMDGKIWPCCHFANAWDGMNTASPQKDSKYLKEDPEFIKVMEKDKDFNSLKKHSISTIIKHTYFTEWTFKSGWESNNCSKVCINNCGTPCLN